MRRLLQSFLLLLGLLLLLLGTTTAALTGPDDTVPLATQELGGAEGLPVVTVPALTAFTGVDVVVTASSSGGVFLGSAHRVDLRDLLSDVEHFEVTQALPGPVGGIGGAARGDGEFALPRNRLVEDLEVWQHHALGEGEQRITVPLVGDPVGLFVLPQGEGTPTVGFAVRVEGLFLGSLAVTAVGGLLVVTVLLVRRRKRPVEASPAAEHVAEAPLDNAGRPHAAALRAGLALAMGASVLSGCALPRTVALEEPQKVALEADELEDLVAEHDQRRIRAVKAARVPKSDSGRWSDAFSGPLLDAAFYATASDVIYQARSKRPAPTTAGEHVWSPSFGSYPMWMLADVDGLRAPQPASWKSVSNPKARKPSEETSLTVFTRSSAADHWRASAAVQVEKGSLPAPLRDRYGPIPDADTVARAEKAAKQMQKWWRTGNRKGITIDAELRRIRPNVTLFSYGDEKRATHLEFSTWPKENERLRIVPVMGGHMVVHLTKLVVTLVSPPGETLRWQEPGNLLHGTNARGPHKRALVTSVILLPNDGKPHLLGADLSTVSG